MSRPASPPAIEVDESRRPLLVVTTRGIPTEADQEAYLATAERVLRQQKPLVVVADLTGAGRFTAQQLKRQAEWRRVNADLMNRYAVGVAFAITSPIVRGALTTVLWMQPFQQSYIVLSTAAEAERWAMARLAELGLRVPTRALTAVRGGASSIR